MEKQKNIMIREYPIQVPEIQKVNTENHYYYFQISDFRDEIIKITLIISIISLAVGCIALAIALIK
jgi:hypothetical protein